jgi:phosphate-selective porin OprO/OprP
MTSWKIIPGSCRALGIEWLMLLVFFCAPVAADDRYDAIWSYANLFENPDAGGLQSLSLSGRAQGDWAKFDADQGDFDDLLWRRFRIGFKAVIADDFVVHLEGDFNFNNGFSDSYNRLTDAYFGWSFAPGWNARILKQSAGFTLDGVTSSKALLTPERNNLTNNLWFKEEYFTGATVSGSCAKGWSCKAGIFSSDGSDEISKFDAGYFSLFSAAYDFGPGLGLDKFEVGAHYVHNDKHENANTPKFSDVFSVVTQWEKGPWGLWADVSAGRGYGVQSDVAGLVIMPFRNMTEQVQWVLRYTYLSSDEQNGIRFGRYESKVDSERGDEYREFFAGFNWFFYGHKLKWQTGLQVTTMRDDAQDGGEYDGWGVTTGLRISW